MADRTKKRRAAKRESELLLRTKDDPRKERRYEPKSSPMAVVSVVVMSIGAVLVGAGVYAQWLRGEELGPLKQAPYLLGGGALRGAAKARATAR